MKKLKVKPLGDKIVVKPVPEEKKSSFVVVGEDKKKPSSGVVMAVGPGIYCVATGQLLPMQCKVGMEILFSSDGGNELPIDGEIYLIMRESDGHVIIEK